jgi:His-Xaa-Ser system protein HxsD
MSVEVVVPEDIYPLESVMSAAYVFTDRCYVLFDKLPGGGIKISLSPRPGTTDEGLQAIAGDFQNELLGQALRQRIAERHEKVREVIVARALFGAAPRISEEPDAAQPSDEQIGVEAQYVPQADDDYLEDPLGIAVPWEEKYGKAAGDAPAGGGTGEDRGSGGGQPA